MDNTRANANRTNIKGGKSAYIYSEKFVSRDRSEGELCVKQLRWDGTEFALIGYLPAGMDIGPHVFKRGSLDDCRSAYGSAKATMAKWFPA